MSRTFLSCYPGKLLTLRDSLYIRTWCVRQRRSLFHFLRRLTAVAIALDMVLPTWVFGLQTGEFERPQQETETP